MLDNSNLQSAKNNPRDNFYTRYEDIERELVPYRHHFEGKVVYCNCDDPRVSNFTKFFTNNFSAWKLKRLISTCYQPVDLIGGQPALIQVVDSSGTHMNELRGDGDFRSPECVELLKQSDIVVTNPPFSFAKEYVPLILKSHVKFLIMNPLNSGGQSYMFPSILSGEVWLGHSGNRQISFEVPRDYTGGDRLGMVRWYTNMEHNILPNPLVLTERYNPSQYPRYDNFDAINVDNIKDIPMDYVGTMGVPITIFDWHWQDQFKLITTMTSWTRDVWFTKSYPRNAFGRLWDNTGILKLKTKPEDTRYKYCAIEGAWYRGVFKRFLIRRIDGK